MKQVMKDIILGYLGRQLTKEDVLDRLKENHLSISTYNSILIGILRKIRKKRNKPGLRRKRLSTTRLVNRTVPNEVMQEVYVNDSKSDKSWEFSKILMKIPSLISEKKRMLRENEIEDNLYVFMEYFKMDLKKDKKLFLVIKRGCKEFIKKELDKVRD